MENHSANRRGRRYGLFAVLLVILAGCMSPYQTYLANGDSYARAGRWDDARASYEGALREYPNDPTASAKLIEARKNQAHARAERSRESRGRGEYLEAIKWAQGAIAADPSTASGQQALNEATNEGILFCEQLKQKGRMNEALHFAQSLNALLPSNDKVASLLTQLRENVALDLYTRAQEYTRRNLMGNALKTYLEVGKVIHDYQDTQRQIASLRTALAQKYRYQVSVANNDAQGALSQMVNASLQQCPSDPTRPLLECAAPGESVRVGAKIQAVVGPMQTNRKQERETRSCTYVCGQDTVPNPEFAEMNRRERMSERGTKEAAEALMRARTQLSSAQTVYDTADSSNRAAIQEERDAERLLKECKQREQSGKDAPNCRRQDERFSHARANSIKAQAELGSSSAALSRAKTEVANAETRANEAKRQWENDVSRLGQTPAVLTIPRKCDYSYAVEIHTLTALTNRQLIVEPVGQSFAVPLSSQEIRVDKKDEVRNAIFGKCSSLEIADNLSLPSDQEMERLLGKRIVEDIRGKVRQWYDAYSNGFLLQAQKASAESNNDEANEANVAYELLTGRLRLPSGEAIKPLTTVGITL